jgi:hypothetical protein
VLVVGDRLRDPPQRQTTLTRAEAEVGVLAAVADVRRVEASERGVGPGADRERQRPEELVAVGGRREVGQGPGGVRARPRDQVRFLPGAVGRVRLQVAHLPRGEHVPARQQLLVRGQQPPAWDAVDVQQHHVRGRHGGHTEVAGLGERQPAVVWVAPGHGQLERRVGELGGRVRSPHHHDAERRRQQLTPDEPGDEVGEVAGTTADDGDDLGGRRPRPRHAVARRARRSRRRAAPAARR